jgi:phospholipid/cholesterol/gamma-HCH transport system substrate-binding protein
MSARVGLSLVVGLALIWVTFESLSNGKLTRDKGYTLTASFNNLKELKVGDEVRMAGVKIGSVLETRLQGRKAEAVLLVDKKVQVCKDSKATIAMAGLLGSNYVALDLGDEKSGFLDPGSEMKSVETPDLNSLVTQLGDIGKKVDNALSDFNAAMGGKDGQGLLGKVELLVEDNRGNIREITTNLKQITDKVNKGEGTLGRLVNDNKLHDELMASVGEIKGAAAQAKDFIANAQSVIDQVKTGEGTLGALIYDKQSGENIKIVAKNLRELSDKLNKGQGSLGRLINDDSLFLQAQGAVKKLDRAMDGLADQGPITAVGVAANSLF